MTNGTGPVYESGWRLESQAAGSPESSEPQRKANVSQSRDAKTTLQGNLWAMGTDGPAAISVCCVECRYPHAGQAICRKNHECGPLAPHPAIDLPGSA